MEKWIISNKRYNLKPFRSSGYLTKKIPIVRLAVFLALHGSFPICVTGDDPSERSRDKNLF